MNSKEKIISETVGLKPKIYSLIDGDSKENKKVKRVNKNVAKNIKNFLFNKNMMKHKMKRIQSKLHRIGTYDVWKIFLSCFDDKR